MKIAIVGSRSFKDIEILNYVLKNTSEIISCTGEEIDRLVK